MTLFKKKEIHNIASKSLLNIKSIHYESVSASFCKRAEIRFYTKVKHQYRRSILYAILLSQFKPACKGNVFFFFFKRFELYYLHEFCACTDACTAKWTIEVRHTFQVRKLQKLVLNANIEKWHGKLEYP